ncbi:Uncharacterised protein [Bordetella pertussis]|nr:Uncharacterised protein [Bordetella pertussis]
MRCSTSGRLTPAADTLISTSPEAGSGTLRSVGTRTSGPPGRVISTARMSRLQPESISKRQLCAFLHGPCRRRAWRRDEMAEGVRFELTRAVKPRRFSVPLWLSPPERCLFAGLDFAFTIVGRP